MLKILTAACALAFLNTCEAYKILLVFPLPGKSHSILGEGYVRHLTAAGHEVHYITPYPKKNIPPNLHQIDISEVTALPIGGLTNISAVLNEELDLYDEGQFMELFLKITEVTLANKNVKKILDTTDQTFDVVVVEWIFFEVFAGFSAVFSAPLVWSCSLEPNALMFDLVGEYLNPAYNSDIRTTAIPPFTFRQRVEQLLLFHVLLLFRTFKYTKMENKVYERVFRPYAEKRGRELPPYDVLRYNASLVLGNSHVSLGQPRALPECYKNIGGYHITTEVEPLPTDLQRLMDDAKHGVIYFSMGTNLNSKEFPEKLKKNLLKMFSGLKQTVLWKYEEVLPNLPKNVHILKWTPQQSILSHPNLRIFVTHGGLLSTTEAVHYGVPFIGIPVFGDQVTNIGRAARRGFAKKVDLTFNLAEDLEAAIKDLLTDPSYRAKIKEVSFIYHHRPVSPGKELVHWIEHVAETRGALHLRSSAFLAPWYQKLYLDLAALVLITIIAVASILKRIFKRKEADCVKKNN